MEIRFWGTRGSIPSPGPYTLEFGGNTTCVEVMLANGAQGRDRRRHRLSPPG